MVLRSYWPKPENWLHYWPVCIVTLIAVTQLLFSFAIVFIHTAIVSIGVLSFCIGATPWFIMGFVCWFIFFACWISVFSVTCCNRSSVGCATYVMLKNILTLAFSAVLIDFDSKFINGHLTISFEHMIPGCTVSGNADTSDIMKSLARGQLAGSVILLITSITFIGVYIYVYIRSIRDDQGGRNDHMPSHAPSNRIQQPKWTPDEYQPPPSLNNSGFNNSNKNIICQNCGATVFHNERL